MVNEGLEGMKGLEHDIAKDEIEGGMDEGNEVAKAISSLIEELADDKEIEMFTELSRREIRHISVISSLEDNQLDQFLDNYMKLKVAHSRRGRKELINISDSLGNVVEESKESAREKLKGLLG